MPLDEVEACKQICIWFRLIESFCSLFFLPSKLRPLNVFSETLNNDSDDEPIRGTWLLRTRIFLGSPKARKKDLAQVLSPYASLFIAANRIVHYFHWSFSPNIVRNPWVSEMMFASVKFECKRLLMLNDLLEDSSGRATRLSSGFFNESISWFDKPVRTSKTGHSNVKWWKSVNQSDDLLGQGEMRCTGLSFP
jgi:hypothetical protein